MKTKLLGVVAALALVGFASASKARADVLVNGSFETPTISFPFYENFGSGCTNQCGGSSFPGWTVTTNNVDIVSVGNFPAPAYNGQQYLDLVGFGSTGGISQTFATIPNVKYEVSFAFGNNPGSPTFPSAAVTVTGVNTLLNDVFAPNFSTINDIGWHVYIGSFIADSASATLSFTTLVGGHDGGVLLDGVNVSAVPLPSALPLFASGLGALGLLGWRRKRRSAATRSAD